MVEIVYNGQLIRRELLPNQVVYQRQHIKNHNFYQNLVLSKPQKITISNLEGLMTEELPARELQLEILFLHITFSSIKHRLFLSKR